MELAAIGILALVRRQLTAAVLGAAITLFSPAWASAQQPLDLSGPWLTHSGDDLHFGADKVDETSWQSVTLPATAGTGSVGFTWYRKHFTVPVEWQTDTSIQNNNVVHLHIGAFSGAADVYLNGYRVNALGKTPNDASGAGYSAAPTSSDLTVVIPVSANSDQQQNIKVLRFGVDNDIAIRVFTLKSTQGITGGPLALGPPPPKIDFPYQRTLDAKDNLFDGSSPATFTVTIENETDKPASASVVVNATDDRGAVPAGFNPMGATVKMDVGQNAVVKPPLAFGKPGVYDIGVHSTVNGIPLPDDSFAVGWETGKINVSFTKQPDFDQFWAAVLNQAEKSR